MDIIYQAIIFFIFLTIYVAICNFGFMIPAKIFGVRVERFSIGFPPRIVGKKIGETDYCISWVPLGGYVKMAGMIDESLDNEAIKGEPWEFLSKPYWQRLIIIFGGPFSMLLVGLGLFIWIAKIDISRYFLMVREAILPVLVIIPILTSIKRIRKKSKSNINDFKVFIYLLLSFFIYGAIFYTFCILIDDIVPIFKTYKVILIGESSWKSLFSSNDIKVLASLLGIHFGILNLLPLPQLNGGQIVFTFAEAFADRPISPKVKLSLQQIGMALSLIAMIYLIVININSC